MSKDYAIIAGGCFWCTEAIFENVEGVISVYPGYIGGKSENPSYEQVCTGNTKHAEAVKIEFELSKISYEKILDIFFKTHDPTTLNRQGNDIGTQYRSSIFYSDEKKFEIARKKIDELQDVYGGKIVTLLEKETKFYIAEQYHHKYFSKNPYNAYCFAVIKPKVEKFKSSQR
ncbi:MAG: peptide-methionine (S)-S-oxide reductase [Flavobacteriaceae bacterium TMED212]|nr:MAG: peptide-methionine (S)-S-oxide reductase [Flavobacteriaceae bacterium TMED212]